jgi:hypothetical protein
MCFVILVNKNSVDRYWECKEIGRERRRRIVRKILPWLRPAGDGGDEHYPSKTTLFLKMKVGRE